MSPIPIAAYPFLKRSNTSGSFESPVSPRRVHDDVSRHEYDEYWDAPSTPISRSKRRTSSRSLSPKRRRNSVGGVPSTPTKSPKKGKETRPSSPSSKRRKSATTGSRPDADWDTHDMKASNPTRPSSSKRRSGANGSSNIYHRDDMWRKYDTVNANNHRDEGKIDFHRGRHRRDASLSPIKRRSPCPISPGKARTKRDEKETQQGSFNLGSLLQTLGEIRANLLSPRSPAKTPSPIPSRPSPAVPKSSSTTKGYGKLDVGSAPRSTDKRRIVKGAPPATGRNRNAKRPLVSPRRADMPRGSINSSKRRTPSSPTKQSATISPVRKRQFDKKPGVGFKSLPHQLPLTVEPSADEEVEVVGILKPSSYPRGRIIRRDGKVKEDYWTGSHTSIYLEVDEHENDSDEEEVKEKDEACIKEENRRDKPTKRSRSSSKKKKGTTDIKKPQITSDIVPPKPLYLPDYQVRQNSNEEEEADDGSAINFDDEVSQFLERFDEYLDENTSDASKVKSSPTEQSDDYPFIDIVPQGGDDNSSVTDSDDSSYAEVEVIEEEEVIEGEVKETGDEESVVEICCDACGLGSSCIPDPMVSCPRCRTTFYCSVDCMQWDYSSGDHLSVCRVITK